MTVRNEKGYALVAVLLTITIFMLLAFSFMGQSINSVKQNNALEIKSQSVALSEMGVTYFQQAIQNVYKSNYQSIVNQVKLARENDLKNKIYRSNDDYTQVAIDLMRTALEDQLILVPESVSIDKKGGNTLAKFSIDFNKNLSIIQEEKVLKINFKSIGTENVKSTIIETVMNIDFSGLIIEGENVGGETGNKDGNIPYLPSGNDIPDPANLSTCESENKKVDYTNIKCQVIGNDSYDNNDQLTFYNSIFKVTGNLTLPQMNKDIYNSTIYVMGSITTGNMNSLTQLKLHVNGEGRFDHFNGNGLTDSIIEINGNARFENMKLLRSTIYVGKAGAEFGQINGMTDSVLFVNSNAVIKGLDLGSNSTVCVNGTLTIENNFNNNLNSKVYARESNRENVIIGDTAFKDGGACSSIADSSITWGDLIIYSDYDYKY